MAIFKPFKAVRPTSDKAHLVASRPYDVLNSSEAKIEASGNEFSFLRVIKPEIELSDDINPYEYVVYEKGASFYEELKSSGILLQDSKPCFYVYRLTMGDRSQTGIAGCCHFEEYYSGKIKKHELTRMVKEEDRVKHVDVLNANAEPVFFSYRARASIDLQLKEIVSTASEYDFVAEDGIRHELWIVRDEKYISNLVNSFKEVPALYVADGHHRTAAAARVGQVRKDRNPKHTGDEEYNYFLSVLFSDQELEIYDYNRVVKCLNGFSEADFLSQLEKRCSLIKESADPIKPCQKGEFSVYLNKIWYSFSFVTENYDHDPIKNLDVSLLTHHVLESLLGVIDQRKDDRIDFVGGIRGLEELERRVDSGEMEIAFALFPVSMEELLAVADAGKIMPPKSTWFEPKLRSGLFVHELK
ncbi:MAG: hypothetical protein CMI24_07095 [Opitutae bacterium]|nr:hypothetical protein [Opitutae bacterium]